jgi:hypothetical protein
VIALACEDANGRLQDLPPSLLLDRRALAHPVEV